MPRLPDPTVVFHCVMPGDTAAAAAGTNGAEAKPAPSAPWQVCEALSLAECADADNRCSLCTRLDGKPLCFTPETAAKLPPCENRLSQPCTAMSCAEPKGEGHASALLALLAHAAKPPT